MKQIKRYWVIALLGCSVISFLGCANVKEVTRGIIGISTKDIENARPNAIKKDFRFGYNECYDKVLAALKEMKSYVYAKNKRMIAIYVSQEDTTAVGIFFTGIDENNTEIEVSSGSTQAKEFIAKKLFSKLKEPEKKKEETVAVDEVKVESVGTGRDLNVIKADNTEDGFVSSRNQNADEENIKEVTPAPIAPIIEEKAAVTEDKKN